MAQAALEGLSTTRARETLAAPTQATAAPPPAAPPLPPAVGVDREVAMAAAATTAAKTPVATVPATTTAATPAATTRKRFLRGLLVGDTLIVTAGLVLPAALDAPWDAVLAAMGMSLVWLVALIAFRTRAVDRLGSGATEYKRVLDACLVSCCVLAVIGVIFPGLHVRWVLLVVAPSVTAALLLFRILARRRLNSLAKAGSHLSRVVVVGSPLDARFATTQLRKHGGNAYHVVASVLEGAAEPITAGAPVRAAAEALTGPRDVGHGTQDKRRPGAHRAPETGVPAAGPRRAVPRARRTPHGRGAPVLPAPQELHTESLLTDVPEHVRAVGADAVLVAGPLAGGSAALRELAWVLEESGTELIVASSLPHVAGPRLRMRPIEGLPLLHVEAPSFQAGHVVLKRCLDVIGAGAALLLLSPVFALLALMVRLDSSGPVFYSQERVGEHERRFRMLKFRSMVKDADARLAQLSEKNEGTGVLFKIREDPRVTKVGRWMRKHSLDELPQFMNVLRGEMSLVGPRPPLPREVEAYDGHAGRRLVIKPGLTGLWQVSGRSDLDAEESLRLDLYYVENWSIIGDVMIMWRTLKVMLNGSGAY